MKKRVLLLCLCFAMVFSCSITSFANESYAGDYYDAASTLKRFGIVDADVDANSKITFGDFLGMAMKLTGISDIAVDTSKSLYLDVNVTDKNYPAVVNATNMGIVSGWGDGTLGYKDSIDVNRASKILVSILGYEPHATAKGGYPAGYVIVAGSTGILDGVSYSASEPLTWGQAMQMVRNCLEIDILQPESYPAESYITVKGENPLTKWMKILVVEGMITETPITTISGGEGCMEGCVSIDGELYVENGTNASRYLGCKIKAYYKESDGSKPVLLDVSIDSEGKIYEISGDAIEPETTLTKIHYYVPDSDKVQTLSVDPDAYIFYNFKKLESAPSDDHFMPENGSLTLIDYDGDKKCDVVYVNESVTYVVDEVNHRDGVISDMYGQKDLRLSEDDDKTVKFIMDGHEAFIEDVAKNQVLTVTMSEDGAYVQVEISYRKVKDTLSGMSDKYITMKNHNFEILSQNKSVFENAPLGRQMTVLIDKYERASGYYTVADDGLSYAYLVKCGMTNPAGLKDAEVFCKLYCLDGNFYTYKVSDEVKINSSRTNSDGEKYDAEKVKALFTKSNGKVDHQLIKFELDENGEISKLQTAKKNRYFEDGGTGVYDEEFSLEFSYYAGFTGANRMLYKNGTISNKYFIGTSTGISIPNQNAWDTLSDSDLEKIFSVFIPERKYTNDESIKTMDIYDVDESFNGGVIIVEGEAAQPTASPDLMLVESTGYALDEDGMEGFKVTGMYKGEYQSIFVKTDSEAFAEEPDRLTLKPGDVVRLAVDNAGKITNIVKVFTLDYPDKATGKYAFYGDKFYDMMSKPEYISDPSAYYVNTFATAYWEWTVANGMYLDDAYYAGDKLCINVGKRSADAPEPPHYITGKDALSYVYIFNEATGTVRLGKFSPEDVYADDNRTVFIWNRYGVARNLIIFEHKDPVTDVWWEGYYDK